MKTNQLFFLGILVCRGFFCNGQNVQSNATLTSGGLNAGTATSGGNTFYGSGAGKNTVNSDNTFIGNGAGFTNTIGIKNTYIGAAAGQIAAGSSNIAIGMFAGVSDGGSSNIFIGNRSGAEDSYTGNGNIYIGHNSGFTDTQGGNKLIIDNGVSQVETVAPLIYGDFANDLLRFHGKVGIGGGGVADVPFGNFPITSGIVNVSNYKLFVKGGILTEEVRVSLATTWADYVFNKEYKLPTLQEVEQQIQSKGHLFNVPSAKEVKENGIELGEMAKIQQEKIEELTLYVIEQNKINEKQSKEIQELRDLLNLLISKNK